MRLAWLGLLGLSVALGACGRGSSASSVSVSCGGQTLLVGAKYVNVIVDPASRSTVLSFPDPINSDTTATIVVERRCTVSPTADR